MLTLSDLRNLRKVFKTFCYIKIETRSWTVARGLLLMLGQCNWFMPKNVIRIMDRFYESMNKMEIDYAWYAVGNEGSPALYIRIPASHAKKDNRISVLAEFGQRLQSDMEADEFDMTYDGHEYIFRWWWD